MTDQLASKYDFQIERKWKGTVVLVTPLTHRAWEWCRSHLSTCVEWGQSYLMDTKRGNPLKGYLEHKEGFRVRT